MCKKVGSAEVWGLSVANHCIVDEMVRQVGTEWHRLRRSVVFGCGLDCWSIGSIMQQQSGAIEVFD